MQLEGVLNISRFSIRISRDEIPKVIEILRAIPAADVRRMQGELAKVWERFTYSGVFKREYALQRHAAISPKLAARVGQASASDTPSFAPLEHRLRGRDAVDGLIELLRLRMVRRAVSVADPGSAQPAGGGDAADYIDHGVAAATAAPIAGYRLPDTRGVQ